MDTSKPNLEKILEEKLKLEQTLHEHFSKKITIMFTDIKGSTSYFELCGDFAGRTMIHQHNSLVLPIISENKGVLVKTIGDATMSAFEDPFDALLAAALMQKKLREFNRGKTTEQQIHIRIGLNYGTGIMDETDIFGDVVNVASRVECLADADEILLTEMLYRETKGSDEFIFRYFDTCTVKGKAESIRVFRLLWHEEELQLGKTRTSLDNNKREDVFTLEASVAGDILKISGFERIEGEERPVKNYSEKPYNSEQIKEYTKGIIELFNRSNKRGKTGNDILVRLKEFGTLLYDELFPLSIKESLTSTGSDNLIITMDDQLVQLPWELLYDGKDFLCQRFSIGRIVKTRQAVSAIARSISKPLKMQIIADPRGDLEAAYEEGVSIRDELGRCEDWLEISLKTTSVKKDHIKSKIRNFDIVHYAGHAEHLVERPEESGWLLQDGKLSAQEILAMKGQMPMPALVFSNACQTGHSDEWKLGENYEEKIFGLANAFLLAGVQNYIGTFWEIPDEAGRNFAISFYQGLISGMTVGEAVRKSRQALIEKYGEDTIVWAGYMLYGDPSTRYIQQEIKAEPLAEPRVTESIPAFNHYGTLQVHSATGKWRTAAIAAAVLLLVTGVAFVTMNKGVKGGTPQIAATAVKESDQRKIDELVSSLATRYREGKFAQSASRDDWSSRPLTMAVMDIRIAGTDNGAGSESDKFVNLLNRSLQSDQAITVVEREILDKLLAELKLGSSALADPATALKLGKVFSAGFIVTGSVMPEKSGQAAILRLIDTETTAVRKIVSAQTSAREISAELCSDLARQVGEWVKAELPLKGRVLSVAGQQCKVNLGQIHGLKKGAKLEVVAEAKKGSGIYVVTGELDVSEIEKERSTAIIISGGNAIRENEKIRARSL